MFSDRSLQILQLLWRVDSNVVVESDPEVREEGLGNGARGRLGELGELYRG